MGAVRIFTAEGVFCGHVYNADESIYYPAASDANYYPSEYDSEDTDWSLICEINSYWSTDFEYGDLTFAYGFQNQTTGSTEQICIQQEAFVDTSTCDNYQSTLDDDTWYELIDDVIGYTEIILRASIGCRICNEDAEPYITYEEQFGMPVLNCKDDLNSTAINEPCGFGQITAMVGVIESLEELECVTCESLIPNCTSCNSSDYCSLCAEGYRQATIKDSEGNDRVLCLYEYCGVFGSGDSCQEMPAELENCARSGVVSIDNRPYADCTKCNAGYFLQQTDVEDTTGITWQLGSCNGKSKSILTLFFLAQIGQQTLDFFI